MLGGGAALCPSTESVQQLLMEVWKLQHSKALDPKRNESTSSLTLTCTLEKNKIQGDSQLTECVSILTLNLSVSCGKSSHDSRCLHMQQLGGLDIYTVVFKAVA